MRSWDPVVDTTSSSSTETVELEPADADPAGARIIPVVTHFSSGRLAVTHIDEMGS